jgi:hypothetical protein
MQGPSVPFRHESAGIKNAADRETGYVALRTGFDDDCGIGRGRSGPKQLSGRANHYGPDEFIGGQPNARHGERSIAPTAPNEPLDPHGITSVRLANAVICHLPAKPARSSNDP